MLIIDIAVKARTSFKTSGHTPPLLKVLPCFLLARVKASPHHGCRPVRCAWALITS